MTATGKATLTNVLMAFIIVAMGVGAGLLLWKTDLGQRLFHHKEEKVPSDQLTMEDLLNRDRKVLAESQEGTSPDDIYQALLRLGRAQDKDTKAQAQARLSDTNSMIRSGAAESFGYYDGDDVVSALKKTLDDPDPTVRMGALRGLGHRPGTERAQLIKSFLQRKDLTDQERVSAYENLTRIASPAEKNEIIGRLVAMASQGEGSEPTDAALRAASLSPTDARVIQMLKQKIKTDRNDQIVAVATRHLASLKDPWVTGEIPRLASHSSPQVRAAAVGALHEACPKERWQILEDVIKKDVNPDVIKTALREPSLILGPEAKDFMAKIIENAKLAPDAMAVAKESMATIEKDRGPGVCK